MTDFPNNQVIEPRRKRINRIKQAIIIMIFILILIPIIICIYLAFKVNNLENQLDRLLSLKESGKIEAVLDSYGEVHLKAVEVKNNISTEAFSLGNDESNDGQEENTTEGETESVEGKTESVDAIENTIKPSEDPSLPGYGKTVCLTFDDGPSENTDKILDILNQYSVKATFFVVGQEDATSIERMQRIVKEGHTIGFHSYSHSYSLVYSSIDSYIDDVTKIHSLVFDATGIDSIYYRFPGGSANSLIDMDIKECIDYLDKKNYEYFDWNVSSGDASSSMVSVDQIMSNIFKDIYKMNTAIVLMHDPASKTTTVEALPKIIERLQTEGFTIKAIDDSVTAIQQIRNE